MLDMVGVLGLGNRFFGGMRICHSKFVKRRKDEYPEVYVNGGFDVLWDRVCSLRDGTVE